MANKYFLRSRRSEIEARSIIGHFSRDNTATETIKKTRLNKETVDGHFFKIRRAILNYERRKFALQFKKISIGTSLFLSNRLSKKLDKSSRERFFIVNLLFNNGQLVSDIFCDDSIYMNREIQLNLMKLTKNNQIFSFGFADSKFEDPKIPYCDDLNGLVHSNGKSIEIFTLYTRDRLSLFNGHAPHKFIFHLKECQWRFNNSQVNEVNGFPYQKKIYKKLLNMLEADPG